MNRTFLGIIATFLLSLMFLCGFEKPPNTIHIHSLDAIPALAEVGDRIKVEILASDLSKDHLTYQWSVSPQWSEIVYKNGVPTELKFPLLSDVIEFNGFGNRKLHPNKKILETSRPGDYTIKCTVTNSRNQTAEKEIQISYYY